MKIESLWFAKIYISTIILAKVFAEKIEEKKIVGGDDAQEGSYGYTVSIQHNHRHTCGGGIIGDYFILSAAHCFVDKKGQFFQKSYMVVAGGTDLSNLPRCALEIPVETIFVLRDYRPQDEREDTAHNTRADIAVVRLKDSLNIHEHPYLKKLTFSISSLLEWPGRSVMITGFGDNTVQILTDPKTKKEYEKSESYGRMRYAKAKLISLSKCRSENFFILDIHDSNICAKMVQRDDETPEGTCSGDSGGPLVRSGNVIVGILSKSPFGCREDEEAAVYTRVTSYKSFIRDVKQGRRKPYMRVASYIDFGPNCMGFLPFLREEKTDSEDGSSGDSSSSGGIHFK